MSDQLSSSCARVSGPLSTAVKEITDKQNRRLRQTVPTDTRNVHQPITLTAISSTRPVISSLILLNQKQLPPGPPPRSSTSIAMDPPVPPVSSDLGSPLSPLLCLYSFLQVWEGNQVLCSLPMPPPRAHMPIPSQAARTCMKAAKCPLVFILGRPRKRLETLDPSADPSRLPDLVNPAFFAGAPGIGRPRSEGRKVYVLLNTATHIKDSIFVFLCQNRHIGFEYHIRRFRTKQSKRPFLLHSNDMHGRVLGFCP